MKHFRMRTVISVAMVLILATALALPIVQAQEATSTPAATSSGPVACDSALVLLVAFTQKDFGYSVPTDIGPFDWGQYSAVFQTSTTAMSTPEATMSSTQAASIGGTLLQLPVVLGEDPQCTQLRTDVVNFLSGMGSSSSSSTSSSSSSSSSSSTTANITPESSTSASTAIPAPASTPGSNG